jgi:DNA-binding LacI/PurR family transcriptional regulator
MSASLKEVAAKVGLSDTTVSLVLRGKGDKRFPAATRQRILAAAAEVNYRPNVAARTLRTQRTNVIGFYTSQGIVDSYDPFFSEVVHGMRIGCADADKKFLLFGDYRTRSVDEIYAELTEGHVDGLVVLLSPDHPIGTRLAASPLPVVAIADVVPGLPAVVADDRGGSRLVAEYLAQKGHRRILYRRGIGEGADARVSHVRRYLAFREAAAQLGMTVTEDAGVYDQNANEVRLSASELERLHAPVGVRPTAVVCYDDISAYALLNDCRRLGIRVPDDLAVVGFDGCPRIECYAARLTTIRAGWSKVVHTAVSLVQALHEGREIPDETIVPATFILGETA